MDSKYGLRLPAAPRRAAVGIAVACALVAPAAAFADPGTPGVTSAQTSVYPTPGGPIVLGEQTPPTGSNTPAGETIPAADNVPAVAPASPAAEGSTKSIPFTGLSAVMMLGAALILLAGGGAMRFASRRQLT